ncbi:MAG: DUF3341 domain-containing protein [Myxococcota bacterium]
MSTADKSQNLPDTCWGLVASFDEPDLLIEASRRVREAGYRRIDAYSPMPLHALDEALGIRRTILPWIVLVGGILGGLGGLFLQYWTSAVDYPLNIGGRPLASWPAFIPITFECTILVAGLSTVVGLFALCDLPKPYHPIFDTPGFERVSVDKFFLSIEAHDPIFDINSTRKLLEELNADAVEVVEH